MRVIVREKPTNDGSGPPWASAFGFYNPDWPSLKTSQDSCEPWLADQGSLLSESSSLIWPNSGTTLDGVAYELPMWELHISDRESSSSLGVELLPTPGANDMKGVETTDARSDRGAGGHSLRDLPALLGRTLPTPTAGDSKSSGSRNLEGSKAHAGVSLTDLFRSGGSTEPRRMLPTPTTQDAANNAGPSQHRRNSDPLNVSVVKMLPTPIAHPARRGKGSAERYRGPKSQGGRRSNLEDAMEAVKERSPWIQASSGGSFGPRSKDGGDSPDPHPDQLTIWDD